MNFVQKIVVGQHTSWHVMSRHTGKLTYNPARTGTKRNSGSGTHAHACACTQYSTRERRSTHVVYVCMISTFFYRFSGRLSRTNLDQKWYDHGRTGRTVCDASALCIRYGYHLADLPEACVCGRELTTSHALTCHTGGYTVARHNEVRDLIADLIREAGIPDVETEPKLLPCNGSDIPGGRSLNRSDEARLDVRARGFWSSQQDAFFDVRITHPAASVLSRPEALSQLRSHERAKKTTYASRVVNVDRGSFTPLVFSTYGICGPETTIFLKSLASLFVERNRDLSYSVVMGLLRTQISFCLMRWCVTCFRGCRSSYTRRRGASFVSQCRQLE